MMSIRPPRRRRTARPLLTARPLRAVRPLRTALAGAATGVLVVGLAGLPARAASGSEPPLGTAARTAGRAHFEPGPCPRTADPVPALESARCGTLTVPENRARPTGRTITLGVAVVPAAASRPARDPIVWFAGGPGDDAVSEIPLALGGGLNRDRDVIFMSQRGTYSADPALTCPNIDQFNADALGLVYGAPSTGRLHVEATRACRDRLASRGVDLSAYNSTESAADYADLRVALGIRQWNVFGISYGTDLALLYQRLHPEGLRSVGIDGILPPSLAGGAVTWKAAREGFDGIFTACAEQPACNDRYPDLKSTFERLVSELEARPVTTTVTVPDHAEPVKVVLDGGVLVSWLTFASHLAAGVPRSIDELAHGNPQRIAEQWAGGKLSPQAFGRLSHGLAYGVFCSEWTPFESEADVIRAGREAFPSFPESVLANAPGLAFLHEDCRAWDVPAAPRSVRKVTRSDIPTLVLSGGFDSQTAPSSGPYAARTLSRSTEVTVPYVAHVVFADSPCAQSITTSFFDTPTAPDTQCLDCLQPPEFEIGT
ncbi:alpha/beta fold hydrolase [Kitasatospora paracochleata]|uniref:Pimeloyl-ACP methyl ester carboxylesterase n=1 Tax=Kitasatospora paracochleata TaxID=58354 RepID=A0ABT1J2S0_9ACTN|nr:alpha/beta fold hydrolase [Kitasatospora paracochleata]MCP2311730.1 pimeloyl-ACP methyl ester carboxylesterase [Kitasatospora paracochleata]